MSAGRISPRRCAGRKRGHQMRWRQFRGRPSLFLAPRTVLPSTAITGRSSRAGVPGDAADCRSAGGELAHAPGSDRLLQSQPGRPRPGPAGSSPGGRLRRRLPGCRAPVVPCRGRTPRSRRTSGPRSSPRTPPRPAAAPDRGGSPAPDADPAPARRPRPATTPPPPCQHDHPHPTAADPPARARQRSGRLRCGHGHPDAIKDFDTLMITSRSCPHLVHDRLSPQVSYLLSRLCISPARRRHHDRMDLTDMPIVLASTARRH